MPRRRKSVRKRTSNTPVRKARQPKKTVTDVAGPSGMTFEPYFGENDVVEDEVLDIEYSEDDSESCKHFMKEYSMSESSPSHENPAEKNFPRAKTSLQGPEAPTKKKDKQYVSQTKQDGHDLQLNNANSDKSSDLSSEDSNFYAEDAAEKIYREMREARDELSRETSRILKDSGNHRRCEDQEYSDDEASVGCSTGIHDRMTRAEKQLEELDQAYERVVNRRFNNQEKGSKKREKRREEDVKNAGGITPPVQISEVITLDSDSDIEILEPCSANQGFNPKKIKMDIEETIKSMLNIKECQKYNELISVKIIWKLGSVEEFHLRKYQMFTSIHQHYARLEDAPIEQIFLHGGKETWKSVEPYDTPDSIGLNSDHILEGGVLPSTSAKKWTSSDRFTHYLNLEENEIEVRVLQEKQRSFPVRINNKEKLVILYIKVGEQLETECENIRLYVDGEIVHPNLFPPDLELQHGDAVDLTVK